MPFSSQGRPSARDGRTLPFTAARGEQPPLHDYPHQEPPALMHQPDSSRQRTSWNGTSGRQTPQRLGQLLQCGAGVNVCSRTVVVLHQLPTDTAVTHRWQRRSCGSICRRVFP
jgi:hypothetical protein